MTTGAAASAEELGQRLVRTSTILFLASPLLLGPLLGAGADWLSQALALEPVTAKVVINASRLAPWHFNLLSPLLAKRLLGGRARRLLPAESILVLTDDAATWWLFAHATAVTAAALAVYGSWWNGVLGHELGGMLLVLALSAVLWPYRVIVVTRRWFRLVGSLADSVGVLSREMSGYRGPERFFLHSAETHEEVVLERVDGARLDLKYVDAARLAVQAGATAGAQGVREVWRAAGPGGSQVVAAWLGRS